ncbi:sporulation protein YqfC [Clostridium frigidicarnis]|uniref:Sporulation protein YqfC n=1 Tax=Clostridium frigidicarnis TaxID=84698 RepID=A0A1I0VH55_9CLOT|nr:sporulation protein YqfC [Clostridium frigidicarnis]SFA75714.1 sporulation protein YqfC [Clostridium frigidicarnis]
MESKFRKAKEHFAETLDIPTDIVLDLPRIIIKANEEITIENHKGIISFDDERVRLDSKMGVILVEGENFQIVFMGGSTLILKGKFKGVKYE